MVKVLSKKISKTVKLENLLHYFYLGTLQGGFVTEGHTEPGQDVFLLDKLCSWIIIKVMVDRKSNIFVKVTNFNKKSRFNYKR